MHCAAFDSPRSRTVEAQFLGPGAGAGKRRQDPRSKGGEGQPAQTVNLPQRLRGWGPAGGGFEVSSKGGRGSRSGPGQRPKCLRTAGLPEDPTCTGAFHGPGTGHPPELGHRAHPGGQTAVTVTDHEDRVRGPGLATHEGAWGVADGARADSRSHRDGTSDSTRLPVRLRNHRPTSAGHIVRPGQDAGHRNMPRGPDLRCRHYPNVAGGARSAQRDTSTISARLAVEHRRLH